MFRWKWYPKILNACPNQTWRTLTALWRIGGLRLKEPLALTWDCVNWEKERLRVISPKTSRHAGKDERIIPLYPELRGELEKQFEEAEEGGSPYIIVENRRENYHSGFKRILFWAGLPEWPRLFQNMRASRDNDLIEAGYPTHVVAY
ncbi:MAG: tyrosine-type recombinase/integrase [Planctomycetia bacterium]|nr:tyrosine-type recombinase/integrase [Planctomycetia bacterium]